MKRMEAHVIVLVESHAADWLHPDVYTVLSDSVSYMYAIRRITACTKHDCVSRVRVVDLYQGPISGVSGLALAHARISAIVVPGRYMGVANVLRKG